MSQVWKNSYRFCFGIAKRKKSPTLEKGEGVQTTQYHHSYIWFLSHPKKSESAKALLFVFGTSPWARTPSTKQLTTLLYIGLFQLLSLLSQPIDQDYPLVGRMSARIALPRIRERAPPLLLSTGAPFRIDLSIWIKEQVPECFLRVIHESLSSCVVWLCLFFFQ